MSGKEFEVGVQFSGKAFLSMCNGPVPAPAWEVAVGSSKTWPFLRVTGVSHMEPLAFPKTDLLHFC